MIYVVMSAHGLYEDYRSYPLFYSPSKERAEQWCEAAQEYARKQQAKFKKIWSKIEALPADEVDEWNELYLRSQKIRSKYDKEIEPSFLGDVSYSVITLKEIK